MSLSSWVALALVVVACALAWWQLRQAVAEQRELAQAADALLHSEHAEPRTYDPALVDALPEPARRFFAFAIRPGTPLKTVAEITMTGELSLGTKDKPGYLQMDARQVLAAPRGFTWDARVRKGAMRISGSDGMMGERSWTRFRLFGLIPVVRVGDNADHLRSAFGRVVAEAAFWTPAFLLAREGVTWALVDRDTARATVTQGALVQSVDIHVDASGQPKWISLARWSNANPGKVFRMQPFGGDVSDFREVAGFRVPFRVDGGNFFGTPDYFPFYRARIVDIRFT